MLKELFKKPSKEAKSIAKCFAHLERFDKGIANKIGEYRH
jgi:hypothetical protein